MGRDLISLPYLIDGDFPMGIKPVPVPISVTSNLCGYLLWWIFLPFLGQLRQMCPIFYNVGNRLILGGVWHMFTKIVSNIDYHLEKLSPFKLLVILQCNVWYAQII